MAEEHRGYRFRARARARPGMTDTSVRDRPLERGSGLRRSLDKIRRAYFNKYPNRCRAKRAASGDGALTLGNLSRQCQGRQASMMARLLVKSPLALRSGSMRTSSGVLQAL